MFADKIAPWLEMDSTLSLPISAGTKIVASPVHQERAMEKLIRILVANRPKLMRELILGTLADQPWIEIVGEVSDDSEILDHVHRTTPDLLVIATDEPGKRPLICDSLLQLHPELRIIAVAPHKNYSVFYWATLDIHSDEIEPSEEGILSAMRSVAARVGGDS
jgi:chemotaxis response regulator CheB